MQIIFDEWQFAPMSSVNLRLFLPKLLPRAIAWAEEQAAVAIGSGRGLTEAESNIARTVGVLHPERIRLLDVAEMPQPADPELRWAAEAAGLLTPDAVGLTLGHAILIVRNHFSVRLLSHECRHVHQYEVAGSIAAFLPTYLMQLLEYGYLDCPLEIDARNHEVR